MKRVLNILLLCALCATFSCSEDDDDDSSMYKFKDQEAMGKIANVNWTYQDGYASIYDDADGSRISVTLVLAQDETGCNISFVDGDQVFFSLPNVTGLYKLKLDWNSSDDSYTATLFDTEETMNYIATEGAIEILSISETEVSGRIDARYDSENFVNGDFTVSICD